VNGNGSESYVVEALAMLNLRILLSEFSQLVGK